MVVSRLKTILFSVVLFSSFEAVSSINSQAMNAKNGQMVSLNLQIKSKNQMIKSDLLMPFYQTAELERKIGNKNVLIELNPRHGKKAGEIALEMKFYNASGEKAFYKKEIVAKLNEDSRVSFRGMSLKIRPIL